MRKYIILFFLVFPFLCACNWDDTPNGIIKPDEMAAVLTEVHIADGSILNLSPAPDTLYKYVTGKYLFIFLQYHTDSAQFRRSFKYYTTKPTEMAAIYDEVLKSLQLKTDSVNKLLAKQNTTNLKRPLVPTGPQARMIPGAAPIIPSRPFVQQNMMAAERANFLKEQAKRDSLLKKLKKKKHALPQE